MRRSAPGRSGHPRDDISNDPGVREGHTEAQQSRLAKVSGNRSAGAKGTGNQPGHRPGEASAQSARIP